MVWHLHDLREPLDIDVTFDYRKRVEKVDDILDIGPARVTGTLSYSNDTVTADLSIDVTPVLACAKTLKPVPYPMAFDVTLVFSDDLDADFALTDPIGLDEVVFGCIMSEKPYVVHHPDASNVSFEKKREPHPAFSGLDKPDKQ
jgi:hypothetical protein